jgi:hypothetical protein
MRTNIEELKQKLVDLIQVETYKGLTSFEVTVNTKKEASGCVSFIAKAIAVINDAPRELTTALYLVEAEKRTAAIFVNCDNHDIVYNSTSPDAAEYGLQYIGRYLDNSIRNMVGMKVEPRKNAKMTKDKKYPGKKKSDK